MKKLTLSLPEPLWEQIEESRGQVAASTYLRELLAGVLKNKREEARRREWIARGRAQYTDSVCRETLAVNEEFPVHEE